MKKFTASVLTLYPEMFPGMLAFSLAGKALSKGIWSVNTVSLRDFAFDSRGRVDDSPAGGGPGMVMRPDVLACAIDSVSKTQARDLPRILMSPRGSPLNQKRVKQLASGGGVIIVCGRFEGIDERVIQTRFLEEISIGDYILSGGEPAAMVLLDAVVRLLPGVMNNPESLKTESFEDGLLEHPHYTRPRLFDGYSIPDVLLSGNHSKISMWRQTHAQKITVCRRPDLLDNSTIPDEQ